MESTSGKWLTFILKLSRAKDSRAPSAVRFPEGALSGGTLWRSGKSPPVHLEESQFQLECFLINLLNDLYFGAEMTIFGKNVPKDQFKHFMGDSRVSSSLFPLLLGL